MGNAMKVVIGIIGIVIAMVVFPIIMSSTHDVQTDNRTELFAGVVTGGGETSANVTLTKQLYNDDVAYVTSITSSLITDVPVASSYNSGTKALTVGGLTAASSRTLTVNYENNALVDYTGMGAVVGITPLLIWVSIIAVVIGGIYVAFRSRA